MTPDKFHLLVQDFTSLQEEDANELKTLKVWYPYSQIIHNLAARAAQDLNLPERDFFLQQSAIYATDRAVLKSIMTTPRTDRADKVNKGLEEPSYQNEVPSLTEPTNSSPTVEYLRPGNDLYEEVERDLAQLSESKHRFEEMVKSLEKSPKHLPNRYKEAKVSDLSHDVEVGLIDDIKKSKKKISPDGHKQKEQIEIIDQFIKAQPTLNKATSVSEHEDLTEKDIQESNLVSETLVEILIKQGKTDKAVEMLKKLIWKFPQKKAYFAARIEELKK
jgi:tetratricopeptide (TPR) repeat protein